MFLPLQMNRKHNHPRLDLVKHIGEFQVLIPCMDIAQAIADLYFGRTNKTFEEDVEADTKLRAVILAFDLY